MRIADWNIESLTGYKPKTTFYKDFSIADRFGVESVKDTYKRAFEEWHKNVEYVTELVMVLNWKINEHAQKGDMQYAELYNKLWEEADGWCMDNLKEEALSYFLDTTD